MSIPWSKANRARRRSTSTLLRRLIKKFFKRKIKNLEQKDALSWSKIFFIKIGTKNFAIDGNTANTNDPGPYLNDACLHNANVKATVSIKYIN